MGELVSILYHTFVFRFTLVTVVARLGDANTNNRCSKVVLYDMICTDDCYIGNNCGIFCIVYWGTV